MLFRAPSIVELNAIKNNNFLLESQFRRTDIIKSVLQEGWSNEFSNKNDFFFNYFLLHQIRL